LAENALPKVDSISGRVIPKISKTVR